MKNGDQPANPLASGNIVWSSEHGWKRIGDTGFSKREHLAAMIMQGAYTKNCYVGLAPEEVALYAVKAADALLEELDKEEV